MRATLNKGLLVLAIVTLACSGGDATSPKESGSTRTPVNPNDGSVVIARDVSAESGVSAVVVTVQSSIIVGQSVAATMVATDVAGVPMSGFAASWSSRNPGVATVTAVGMVTGISAGTTTIDAVVDGVLGSAVITVASAGSTAIANIVVTLTPATASPGQVVAALALVTDAGGVPLTNKPIAWSSSNTGVATITKGGDVRAIAPGTATITASSEGKSGSATFSVTGAGQGAVATVTLAVQNPTPALGATTQITATLRDSSGNVVTNRPITWTSSNAAVATVNQSGLVTAAGYGSAVITATSGTAAGTVTIQVSANAVRSVTVTAPQPTLQPTQTTQLVVTLKDSAGTSLTGRIATYSSATPTVATVTATGLVTGIAKGSTVITVTSEGVVAVVTITVPPVASIVVTAPDSSLQPTVTAQASAALRDGASAPATNRVVTWSSSAPAVATVSTSGLITAVAKGTTTITATSEGVTDALTIIVPPVARIAVTAPGATALQPTRVIQATAALFDSSNAAATNRVVTWSSGTPAVATVSATGVVTGVSVGTSVITAASEGTTGTLTVVVPAVNTVTLVATDSSLTITATTQATATLKDALNVVATNRGITWSSATPSVATVSQTGVVTAVAAGTSVISAVSEGKTGTLTITVSGAPPAPPVSPTTPAELPRVYMNTAAPAAPAAGRVIISVPVGGDLQAALNSAQPGDVLQLAAGATYTGNFSLRNKNTTSTNWITIRPSNWASLPAAGVRMTPSRAAALALPKIVTPNTNNAILTELGAHHYRLMGLDVSVTASNTYAYAAIALDGGYYQTTVASAPHNFVLDRMYIHGTATGTLRRCVALNSAMSAIIDSWLSDCHERLNDSQAIASWNGPGPFKIVNNYLEGAGENIMFGGSDPSIPNMTPSDIEIRRNHVTKPLSWKGGVWTVKNLIEIKHAQRVLIEGNIFENSWQDGQNGTGIVIKSVNQGLSCTWCVTQDVTVRFNIVRNVGAGFNIAGAPDNSSPCPCIPARRITVNDNVISNINVGQFVGDGRGFATYGTVSHVLISHNTMISPTSAAFVLGPTLTQQLYFTATNNLVGGGSYGLMGDNYPGTRALQVYAPGGLFAGNVVILGGSTSWMPVGNSYPASVASIGFVNAAAEDFHLTASSPFKGKGLDGKDPGADVTAVNSATAGVRVAP